MPHTGSIAVPVAARLRRSARGGGDRRRPDAAVRASRRGSTARSRRAVLAPMSSPAGVCTRWTIVARSGRIRRQFGEHGGAAPPAGDQPDVRHAGVERGREHVGSSSRPWDARITASARAASPAVVCHAPVFHRGGDCRECRRRSARRRARRPVGAGTTGSRKISRVPPDRHGLCTVSVPGVRLGGRRTPRRA